MREDRPAFLATKWNAGCLRGERSWRMNGVRPSVCASVMSPVHIHRLSATTALHRLTALTALYRLTALTALHRLSASTALHCLTAHTPLHRLTAPTALQRLTVPPHYSSLLCTITLNTFPRFCVNLHSVVSYCSTPPSSTPRHP